MAQSLAQIYIHLFFSTKNRVCALAPGIHEQLRAYLGGTLRDLKCPSIRIGVVPDHVHILYRHSKNLSIADVIEAVKTASSKWTKTIGPEFRDFYWQGGYAAFSVSASRVEAVSRYIDNQPQHHRTESFEDELRRFFKAYNVEYDERYVWD